MPAGKERGKVVYCIDHGKNKQVFVFSFFIESCVLTIFTLFRLFSLLEATTHPYFTCSRVGGSRGPIKSATCHDINQTEFTLEFESRFESGNLQKAVQV